MLPQNQLCDICCEKPAAVFITRVVEGEEHSQKLCDFCAQVHTEGEDWLKAMAEKFGLPETASLEDVMQGISEQLPLTFPDAALEEYSADLSSDDDTVPNLILEANLQFGGEFPSDEDAADDLEEAWSEGLAEHLKTGSDEEISLESLKANWQMESNPKPSALEIVAERCPKCGTTWDRLREDGRAGCAQCYVAFHNRLVEIMSRMQHDAQHVGKTPRTAQRRRRRLDHLRTRRDHRLEMLNRRLEEAVAAENYEDAAQLRDKIKIVTSTIVSDSN